MSGPAPATARSTRSSSGPARTVSPRPSRWPVPGARSGSTRPPPTAGGGTRTAELTLPGFRHDVCSTILPLTIASPFFRLDRPRGSRASSSSTRTRRSPTRSTAVAQRSSSGPCATTADGLGASGRPGLAPAVRAARPRCRDSSVRRSCGRSSTCRGTRWRSPGSACRRSGRRGAWRAAAFDDEPARAPVRGRRGPLDAPPRSPADARRSGWSSRTFAHAVGWPMVRGGAAGRRRGARRRAARRPAARS